MWRWAARARGCPVMTGIELSHSDEAARQKAPITCDSLYTSGIATAGTAGVSTGRAGVSVATGATGTGASVATEGTSGVVAGRVGASVVIWGMGTGSSTEMLGAMVCTVSVGSGVAGASTAMGGRVGVSSTGGSTAMAADTGRVAMTVGGTVGSIISTAGTTAEGTSVGTCACMGDEEPTWGQLPTKDSRSTNLLIINSYSPRASPARLAPPGRLWPPGAW